MNRTPQQQAAYNKIAQLVKRFDEELVEIKKKQNETETRLQFINPFFAALGWDIDNTLTQVPTSLREVVHEDKVKVEGREKSPDYSFRIDGKRKFFLEAKKPAIDIWADKQPAFQLRRYGWSAKLPISVLTDFEEFALYDCTFAPKDTENATVGRLKYIKYDEYLKYFDWLWANFSKEAVFNGNLDQYAKADKKGSQTVDTAFLQSLDEWRSQLAVSIALHNPHLTEEEINFVVQININRIVFLRNCEDRGVERYGGLKDCMERTTEEGVYFKRLIQFFKEADNKYNAGLFDFKIDTLSDKLMVENRVIRAIINGLYYPVSPYEFSVIGAEILGTAYERFLGKVIRLQPKRKVLIEEKPEVRKAGGVFYTPQYIVEYIVKQTVGKLIEGKSPEEISTLKICDPACGSGSFLLGAYQYLLDYHTDWYNQYPPKKQKGKPASVVPSGKNGTELRLSLATKKAILINNIFGVDLDAQAVEVTKLSLLMKCLENENDASVQQTLATERILPTLDYNIKCGNSLIDFDFYETSQDAHNLKPFSWEQAFPSIFKKGGFDVVIGNPPYVRQELLGKQKEYFQKKYEVYQSAADLYNFFIEKGVKLLKENGFYSVIIANKWMKAGYGKPLRNFLLRRKIVELIDFGDLQVFKGATTYPCILTVQNTQTNLIDKLQTNSNELKDNLIPENLNTILSTFRAIKNESLLPNTIKDELNIDDNWKDISTLTTQIHKLYAYKKELNGLFHILQQALTEVDNLRNYLLEVIQIKTVIVTTLSFSSLNRYVNDNFFFISQNSLNSDSWILDLGKDNNLRIKIEHLGVQLGSYLQKGSYRGLLTGLSEAFIIDKDTYTQLTYQNPENRQFCKAFVGGRNLRAYQKPAQEQYMIVIPKGFTNLNGKKPTDAWRWFSSNYPLIANYLLPFKSKAEKRTDKGDYWWELRACDYYELFEKPKIMYQVFQVKSCFIYDKSNLYCNNSVFFLPTKDKYLLAILNSKMGWYLISKYCTQIQNGYQLIWKYFEKLPIKVIDFDNSSEKTAHDEIVKQVELLLTLNEELQAETNTGKQAQLKGRIQFAERKIDTLVYQLYGLTTEEIRIVEEG